MQVGDQVRVKESVIVHHHPEHKNQPFDIQGFEGEVKSIATEWKGKQISANYPYLIQFTKKFKTHLQASELELI